MQWMDIHGPDSAETIDLVINGETRSEIYGSEAWEVIREIQETKASGHIGYVIWYQDVDETDNELMTLEVMIDYKNGSITNYVTHLMD